MKLGWIIKFPFIIRCLACALGTIFSAAAYANEPVKNILAGESKAATCVSCHGPNGNATVPAWPKLAGQQENYLIRELRDFQNDEENTPANAVMHNISITLSQEDIVNLAAYFHSQTPTIGAVNIALLPRGQALYRGGDIQKEIPACMACHGPQGGGLNLARFPRLSGQNPDYVYNQLKAFQNGTRHDDPNQMMQNIAAKLSDSDMKALASYVYGLH